MRAHIVLAHPEPLSFNAHLANTARRSLENDGWSVTVSDLYAMNFDACERPSHYQAWPPDERFDVQAAQRQASDTGNVPLMVADEIALLDQADLLLLQYPMWWHLPPAILKGWFDRVFIFGDVYTSKKRFENGRFKGKRAMLSVTVGTSCETYAFDGRSGDIDLLLWPVNFSLAYTGYSVLRPFVAYGVEAGLKYSSADVLEQRLALCATHLAGRMADLDGSPVISFNRMSEWGSNGRIAADAPIYSPFVRRKQHLDLG